VYEGYEQYRLGFEVLGPYLAHVHLKNAKWEVTGTREDGSIDWKATWAPIQKGSVDLRRLLDALHDVGYDGWLAFEDFSTEQPIDMRTQENLAYMKKLLEG
jgi:sugar phosphate isomerase/epimerase